MTPEKRGVWADLLALAAEAKPRDGTLRFDVGQPMPRDYISAVLRISRETLDACLDVFSKDLNTDDHQPRVKIWEDGTVELTNFNRYQAKSDKRERKKNTEVEDVPLDEEDRKKSQELAASRLAYLQPEAARKGLERRQHEEDVKKRWG